MLCDPNSPDTAVDILAVAGVRPDVTEPSNVILTQLRYDLNVAGSDVDLSLTQSNWNTQDQIGDAAEWFGGQTEAIVDVIGWRVLISQVGTDVTAAGLADAMRSSGWTHERNGKKNRNYGIYGYARTEAWARYDQSAAAAITPLLAGQQHPYVPPFTPMWRVREDTVTISASAGSSAISYGLSILFNVAISKKGLRESPTALAELQRQSAINFAIGQYGAAGVIMLDTARAGQKVTP